ncbi:putative NLR family CARD domain-containing protein 4 [Apostichopus japonicus]|uniref:Putative NLR family CARD domain-containing protein 4 n=1 Tax=Stichopus japonicus TaxID=307972 RepID=A0A2G8JZT9_STIJA|nr:putative NLR family CARD domain-containing protein 4 [Apostichopus japonicus]
MAHAEPSQSTGRDTGTNLAEGFGRFKNDLADHLDLPVIHKLSNLLGLKRGEIDIIERYRTPGYMMVNRLESQGVISPTSITDLVNMLHQLNLAGLSESIQKSFNQKRPEYSSRRHQLYDENLKFEKKNNLIKYAKIAYQKQYGTAKPFPSMSKCSINSFFVEGGIYYLAQEGDSMQKPDVLESLESYNEILNSPKTESKRKIIEGEPGYGKSTITLQYLYDWCTKNPTSPLKDVDILIYLQLRQLAGVKSIYTAIKKFIVPKDEDMDEACIEEILKVYTKSVVILFDSYDEYPDKNDTETDISSIIEMKMFQEMVVMILTRKLNLPPGLHPDTKRIRLTGFGALSVENIS